MTPGSRMVSLTAPPPPSPGQSLGPLLRHWRSVRRMSQLELSLEADVSTRHLSYVETGRAQPSLEMVMRLADTLELSLRDRNGLLVAAGYAPQFRESGLGEQALSEARHALEFLLRQAEPFPTIVMDRAFELRMMNEGARRLARWLLGGPPAETNVLRLILSQEGLRPWMVNWEEIAGDMIRRAHNEAQRSAPDAECRALMAEVLARPDIPASWRSLEPGSPGTPLLTCIYRKDGVELRFFSTFTTFGTPHDITLEELRMEHSFPADDETEALWHAMAAG